MKVVMTLVVRNEADILDANLAFHLAAGVDFVLATDKGSTDGTREILEKYAAGGRLRFTVDPDAIFRQREVVTRMARLAATEVGADWVVNCDADEFWWPRGGSFEEVLAVVPPRFGVVRGMWRHFVPRPDGPGDFAARMTARVCEPVTQADHAFSPHFKTVHRADPNVRVDWGNHDAFGARLVPLGGWYPFDVLHFPLRTLEQTERKFVERAAAELRRQARPDPCRLAAYEAHRNGRFAEFYESHVVDDAALESGLRDGRLAIDTRLRDALRRLANGGPDSIDFRDYAVDRCYVSELGTLEDRGPLVRAERRIQNLERRLSALEVGLSARLRSRLARASRR